MLSGVKCRGFVSPGCNGECLISYSVNFQSLVCLPREMELEMLAWSKAIHFKQTPVQQQLLSSLQRNQQHLQLCVCGASVLEIMKQILHSLVSTCLRRLVSFQLYRRVAPSLLISCFSLSRHNQNFYRFSLPHSYLLRDHPPTFYCRATKNVLLRVKAHAHRAPQGLAGFHGEPVRQHVSKPFQISVPAARGKNRGLPKLCHVFTVVAQPF